MLLIKFLQMKLQEVKYCRNVIKTKFNKPLKMAGDDETHFQNAKACHIIMWKAVFGKKTKESVTICLVIGRYCGSAHEACNLNFQLMGKRPVIFHNLKGYDSQFFTQQIGKKKKKNMFKDKKKQRVPTYYKYNTEQYGKIHKIHARQ